MTRARRDGKHRRRRIWERAPPPALANPPAPEAPAWETLSEMEALEAVGGAPGGLSEAEAEARLRLHGPNLIPRAPLTPFWRVAARQFASPLIAILGLAAVISVVIGDTRDAGFIAAVLLVNAGIGTYQELRAEQDVHALQRLLRARAAVERAGDVRDVDAETLVPGDVVWLESGQRVPADLRLLASVGLETDESLLTGESTPVPKDATWRAHGPIPLGDRRNMAHAGSTVVRGRGRGAVIATGTRTEAGRIARDLATTAPPPLPLLERLTRFSRAIALATLVLVIALAILGILRGYGIGEMFFFAVALAVAAVPEGLPVAITIALAVATTRMVRRNVIVRRLAAVEGLGSCTLIATDKTGTLTCNALTVTEIRLADGTRIDVTGEGYIPQGILHRAGTPVPPGERRDLDVLLDTAALCNEATLHRDGRGTWTWTGDPTDVALLALARKHSLIKEELSAARPLLASIPFEPERRYAATFHATPHGPRVNVKGAPERVLAMCTDPPPGILHTAEAMARRGSRVLALAEGPAPTLAPTAAPPEPTGLRFLGLVGMIDPPRAGVHEAITKTKAAGVDVVMVTGDHPTTALSIAKDLGIATDPHEVATGTDLDHWDDATLARHLPRTRVFARVTPHHKLRIVQAAQRAGHHVAVTGDGVNDAPALRAANIGVAMGQSGTDVAREASDVVLTDDNFASIVDGIEEGRVAYDNVRKVVFLLMSTGAAEVVLATLALATAEPIPLTPVQLLWLNLVTSGIQHIGLAMEPGEGDALQRPAKTPPDPLINRLMIERTLVSALTMGIIAHLVFASLLRNDWTSDAARNVTLLLMVLFQNINVANSRSETKSAFALNPLRNPTLLWGTLAAQLLHLLAMTTPPTQHLLRIAPVSAPIWLTLLTLALTVLATSELHKAIIRRRERRPDSRARSRRRVAG